MDGIVLILLPSFIKIYVSSVTPDPNMCGMRCCAGYFLHNEICTVCRSGQIGENCSQACPTGFYGELCRNDCPFECKNNCNEVTGRCPLDNNTQNNSIETQIEHFLKKNAWLIGGVTFLLLLILCGSIGFIHLSQALKCFKMNRTNDVTHLTSKKPQSSSSSRHEPDYSNIPSGSIRANCSVKSTLTKQLSNKKEGMQSCEYSKPTTKKRYSFIW
ncbi:N-acetylglucosamine-1-phosphodiester alpha-N-acetylglucosaminidase-like, partial [Saccostrea cucullata]|uniref:N-acetylglucosamine-1-phosphodiester alpha-N-acetylglucosaminidase-like n=1 Tax=Saccostrea cuccullata TaxID=36930 RepID=UPI002ED65476